MSRTTKIIGGVAVVFIFGYFLIDWYVSSSVEHYYFEKEPTVEMVIRDYFDIRQGIATRLSGEETLSLGTLKKCVPGLCVQQAFAQAVPDSKGALIARGLATFLEIGRNKDVSEVRRINAEDRSFIFIAKDNLKTVRDNVYIVSRDPTLRSEVAPPFLNALLDQYDRMAIILDELLAYKDFFARETSAAKLDEITRLGDEQIRIFEAILYAGGTEEFIGLPDDFLTEQTLLLIQNLKEMERAFIETAEDLKEVQIPAEIDKAELLQSRVDLRVAQYEAMAEGERADIEYLENIKFVSQVPFIRIYESTVSSEVARILDEFEQNIFEYKHTSKMGVLFAEMIFADKQLKADAAELRERFDIAFFIEDDIDLSDLLDTFYRQEPGELFQRLEQLEDVFENKFNL